MEKSTKTKSAIKPPVLPDKGTAPISNISLDDESEYADFILSNANLTGQTARFLVLGRAWIKQARFNECQFSKSRLSDLRFDGCDMSNAHWMECKFNRVEIFDCKLTGFRKIDAEASDCTFQNCAGELIQFHGSALKKSIFRNCQLKGADFRFCDLEGSIFIDCDLREAEFYNAKLSGTDFRGSDLMGIKAQPEDLKGAIINTEQAMSLGKHFAVLLGLDVKDS